MENGFKKEFTNLNQKLDDLLDLISRNFQVSIPVELYSKSTTDPIPTRVGILPKTSDLQEVDEVPTLDQVILTEKSFICEETGARVLPQISNLQETEEQSEL